MVVVVETPRAVRSPWVQLEVSTVVSRRLGLAAVHLKGGPRIREIDELSRCRIDNDDTIAAFVPDQHRTQIREKHEALLDSVWWSLS